MDAKFKYALPRAFGRRGLWPCGHLYDTPSCHYTVQQTLYAYLLKSKYDISIKHIFLVQCHPFVNKGKYNEVRLWADAELAETLSYMRGRELVTSTSVVTD